MKLKDFDNIRRIEIALPLILNIINKTNTLATNYQELRILTTTSSLIYFADFITSFHSAKLTTEYKQLKLLYNEVITSINKLTKDFELNNPIEIFALYVYLYRNGYLSHNHHFKYDMDMKDISDLQGIDVIRGKGVCRSITTMLTNIYNDLGFKATNLSVHATTDSCENQQQLCDTDLDLNDSDTKKVDKIIKFSDIFKTNNHKITMVNDNNNSYILDPTNDGLLNYDNKKKRIYVKDIDSYMLFKQKVQLEQFILGADICTIRPKFKKSNIDDETYGKTYLETLKKCKNNLDIINNFYNQNTSLYNDIYKLSEEQKSLIQRLVPFIPSPKIKKLKNN